MPVYFITFEKFVYENNIAQVMVLKKKRTAIQDDFAMDADLVHIYIKKFRAGLVVYD